MTLEASLIVPMAVCVLMLLIYFSYYLYGRCMISQDSYILAFRASISREEANGFVQGKACEVTGNKYFGSERPRFTVTTNGDEITVFGKSSVLHNAMGRYFLKPQTGWEYEGSGRAKKREYVKHIRKLKRLKDIGQELTGLGE